MLNKTSLRAIEVVMPQVALDKDQLNSIILSGLSEGEAGEPFTFANTPKAQHVLVSFEVPGHFSDLPEDEAFIARYSVAEYRIRKALKEIER